jgi:cell division protein FtsB
MVIGGRNITGAGRGQSWPAPVPSVPFASTSWRMPPRFSANGRDTPGKVNGSCRPMSQAETDSSPPGPRLLPIVASLLALLLLGFALFGDRGILRALQASRQKSTLQEEVRQLESINAELRQEIESLRNDRRYLEAIARKELGMVKDDELVYQFRSAQKPSRPRQMPDLPAKSRSFRLRAAMIPSGEIRFQLSSSSQYSSQHPITSTLPSLDSSNPRG